jgi:hypothetical protein
MLHYQINLRFINFVINAISAKIVSDHVVRLIALVTCPDTGHGSGSSVVAVGV